MSLNFYDIPKRFNFFKPIFCFGLYITLVSCQKVADNTVDKQVFKSSFELVSDFSNFYITPQGYMNTSFHEQSDSIVHSGKFAHRGWVNGVNPTSKTTNNNHRGYPTIQLYTTAGGVFKTPCYVTLWVWLDMELNRSIDGGENDWFSFATFTSDASDNWSRTVLINLNSDGFVHLMHVPNQGEQKHVFQTSTLKFPQREWVELKVYLDFSASGYAKVWQNGVLVSHALVKNVENHLAQAHFGLYCPPTIAKGMVFNDDLIIEMVDQE